MSVLVAGGLLSSLNVLRTLDHGHVDAGIFRQAHLRSARSVGANGLHTEPVREDTVMTYLVHLRGGQLEAGRELPIPVTEVGKAGELVRSHPVVHAVA